MEIYKFLGTLEAWEEATSLRFPEPQSADLTNADSIVRTWNIENVSASRTIGFS